MDSEQEEGKEKQHHKQHEQQTLRGESQILVEARAEVVAVESVAGNATLVQHLLESKAHSGLTGTREAWSVSCEGNQYVSRRHSKPDIRGASGKSSKETKNKEE